ncbi:MAG: exodeoxyribonuclease VII small subunit [Thermincolia bacterium]
MGKKDPQLSFEEALAQLEAMVKALEAGNLTLDQSLEYYQKGIELSRICNTKLQEAEEKIEMLTMGKDDKMVLQPASDNGTKLVSGD